MERTTDVKETIEALGEDLRGRASRATEPVARELGEFWDDAVGLMKKHPGRALGLAALGGVAAGFVLTRLMAPTESDAEKKVRHWVHNAQGTWSELRDGFDQILNVARSTVGHLK